MAASSGDRPIQPVSGARGPLLHRGRDRAGPLVQRRPAMAVRRRARRPGRRARDLRARPGRRRFAVASSASGARPVLGAGGGGCRPVGALGVAALPASIAAHERAVDYGISTQASRLVARRRREVGRDRRGAGGGGSGPADRAGAALRRPVVASRDGRGRRHRHGLRLARAGGAWRRSSTSSPRWPPNSPARAEVLALARRAGVDVGQVYRVEREPPGALAQRVRRRDRFDEAGGPLRQPASPGQPARAARASSLTSSAT